MIEIGEYGINLIPLFLLVGVIILIGLQMIWGARYRTDIANQQLRMQHLEKRLANTRCEQKRLELGLTELKRRQWRQEARGKTAVEQGDASDLTYGLAVKLARSGVSVEDLAKTCGLTRGEAELLAVANGIDRVRQRNGKGQI